MVRHSWSAPQNIHSATNVCGMTLAIIVWAKSSSLALNRAPARILVERSVALSTGTPHSVISRVSACEWKYSS